MQFRILSGCHRTMWPRRRGSLFLWSTALLVLALGVVAVRPDSPAEASTLSVAEPQLRGGEATIYHMDPDGSGWLKAFQVPDNVTLNEFYQGLAVTGVTSRGVVVGPTAPSLDPQNCYFGTAYAMQGGFCPPKTWTYQGHPRPIVYFRDYTGSAWPVHAATSTWNASTAIDSRWIPYTTACPTNVHCVHVLEGDYGTGSGSYCGATYLPWDANGNFIDGSVNVFFNNENFRAGVCHASHRSTVCHELGHALGLDHDVSTASCLYYRSVAGRSDYPKSDDFWVLANISY
jgi:Metallo-peptidase family M12B Reprolysin-like